MNDLISRQAAIDAIAKMMPQSFTPDGSHPADKEIFIAQEAFADCIKTIEILPSAQPERIRGRWIAKEKKNLFRCSKCDAVIYSESEYDRNKFHKFCGRCGADMREVTT